MTTSPRWQASSELHAHSIPKQRYIDAEFARLEAEKLWPHVWQMACRLEEISIPHMQRETAT